MWWHYHLVVYVLLILADRHVEGFSEEDQRCRLTLCLSEEDQRDVDSLVKKRHFDDDGEYSSYTVAKAHWSQEQDGEKERVNTAHVRRKRDVNAVTHLHIETDKEQFDLELHHTDPVLTEGGAVVQRWGDTTWLWEEEYPRDCYMTGHMANNMSNTVSLSYCSHLMGSFTNGTNRYWIEFISNTHAEDSSTEHLVMALQQEPFKGHDAGPIDNGGVPQEIPTMEGQRNVYPSAKEAKQYEKINVEMFFMFDQFWTEWANSIGYETQAEQIELILTQLNAVQLLWARAHELKYDITFHIKKMEFWKKNAGWYKLKKGDMVVTLNSVCAGTEHMSPRYDLVHMVTGHPDQPGMWGTTLGIAKIPGACGANCGMSWRGNAGSPIIIAHEIGHNMNMAHVDPKRACQGGTNGVMDYQGKEATQWSQCSADDLDKLMQQSRSKCLREENVKAPLYVELIEAHIGMTHDDDTICQIQFGPGKYISDQQMRTLIGVCKLPWVCVNVDDSDMFGFVKVIKKAPGGEYCGDGKACSSTQSCQTYEEQHFDPNAVPVIAGAWGNWGPLSTKCSRTCGTGVKIRERQCNNPRSQRAPQCKGPKFEATMCNTESCPDEKATMTTRELQIKRAKELCSFRKDKLKYPFWQEGGAHLFETVGFPMDTPHECKIICKSTIVRQKYEFDGIYPHATPCNWDSTGSKPSFADEHGLISRPGLNPRCLMGVCQLFGCDGKSGPTKFDACGVCGGSNSTCHLYTGTFKESMEGGQREVIFNFTADPSFIDFQVYFNWKEMKGYRVELWTADDEPIISRDAGTKMDKSEDAPIKFGGAEWHYSIFAGFIYSEGPFNMNATIKVYCKTTGKNKGVHYSYIVPIADIPKRARPKALSGDFDP